MQFQGNWLTTEDFYDLLPIEVFHREYNRITPPAEAAPCQNYHAIFRKEFSVNRTGNYSICISADDYYKLYVNGQFIGQGPAQAYHTAYNYNCYDISAYISLGENTLEAHIYHNGMINRAWQSGDNRFGLIADIASDGAFLFGTDGTWEYSRTPEYVSGGMVGYATDFLENIDFTCKTRTWKKALLAKTSDHVFLRAPAEPLSVYTVKPERIVKIAPGKYFFDFGTELCGQPLFSMQGKAGQKVTFLYGEETEADDPNRARWQMRARCDYKEICTLSGGVDTFAFYNYKAFRYMNIESDIDNIPAEEVRVVVRHARFENTAVFESSNPLLNRIWEMCKNTVKWGTQENFVDCPSREKGQYLGDFGITGPAYMYLTGDGAMYKKTLLEFASSTQICRGMMGVAPGSFMQEIADYSLMYPMLVLQYYNYTGDMELLRTLYPVIQGILGHFAKFEKENLLQNVNDKWNLVDWPDNLRDNYEANLKNDDESDHGTHNVMNAWYIGAVEATDKIRKLLGLPQSGRVVVLKEAFCHAFYDADKKLFKDSTISEHCSLHANVLPVLFDIVPEEARKTVLQHLQNKGLACGMWFSYFELKALAKLGAYDTIYAFLTNESEHSWANMLREGATTCFEAWGKDQKWNTSLCHPFGTAPIIAIIEDIVGVTFRGEDKPRITPHRIKDLTYTLKLPWKAETLCIKMP